MTASGMLNIKTISSFGNFVKVCSSTASQSCWHGRRVLKCCQIAHFDRLCYDFPSHINLFWLASWHFVAISAAQQNPQVSSSAVCASFHCSLDGNVSQEVKKLLRVVLQHKSCGPLINLDHDKHNPLVHCGRTKVFLTQPTVSSQTCLCTAETVTGTIKVWADLQRCCCCTAEFAGGSEEEDPVSVCLHHPVLLAALPVPQTPLPPKVRHADPSR